MSSIQLEIALLTWICLSVWYYGYHISELNFPQPSLTCSSANTSASVLLGLPNCLNLTSGLYSLATAIFTVGGLFGSLISSRIVEQRGMLGGIKLTGWINLVSSACMTFAPHWFLLVLGRFIGGLASGLGLTLVPPLLSTIAKTSQHRLLSSHSGAIGILNQVAISVGIVCGQMAGLVHTGVKGDGEGGWRWVVAVSGVVAAGQIVGGKLVKDGLLERREGREGREGREDRDEEEGQQDEEEEVEDVAMRRDEASPLVSKSSTPSPTLSVSSLLSSPSLRPQIILIGCILAAQQLSGINACMFYSTSILQSLLPASAGLISIGISVVNLVMTFPAIVLIDRVGRKPLLLTSIASMALCLFMVGFGLNNDHSLLTGIFIVLVVASFALALGAIPFLLVPEIMPSHAIPASQVIALSCSWITSFFVAIGFLPLRNLMSSPIRGSDKRVGEGNVFGVFVCILALAWLGIWRYLYRMPTEVVSK